MTLDGIIAKHSSEIEQIKTALAINFDVPAQRIINAGFERMGIQRFTRSGDDLWEMITCKANGWEYQRPSAELVNRWARY